HRQRQQLHSLSVSSIDPRIHRPPPAHQGLHTPPQRKNRALPADPRRRMPLRPPLHLRNRQTRGHRDLEPPLQLPSTPHRLWRPAPGLTPSHRRRQRHDQLQLASNALFCGPTGAERSLSRQKTRFCRITKRSARGRPHNRAFGAGRSHRRSIGTTHTAEHLATTQGTTMRTLAPMISRRLMAAAAAAAVAVPLTAAAGPAASTTDEAPQPTRTISSAGNPIIADGSYYMADAAPLVVGDTMYIYGGHDEAAPQQAAFEMHEYGVLNTTDVGGGSWDLYEGNMKPGEVFDWASGNGAYAGQVVPGKDGRYYWYAPVESA